jgi:hypothetical protein
MAVQDDLRRLTQVDSIYLGCTVNNMWGPFSSWFKGRLQQANDGSWIVRSISTDGAVSGFQLGQITQNWQSTETPNTGITVYIPIILNIPTTAQTNEIIVGSINLCQQLPQELTNEISAMRREGLRRTSPSWRGCYARHDAVTSGIEFARRVTTYWALGSGRAAIPSPPASGHSA